MLFEYSLKYSATCPTCLRRTRGVVCKACSPTPLPRLPGFGQGLLRALDGKFYRPSTAPAQSVWALPEEEELIAPHWMSHREVAKKKSRRDWKPAPKGEVYPLPLLGFKPLPREGRLEQEPARAPPPWAPFRDRCSYAEEQGWTWMRIAGLIMPADSAGRFVCYHKRPGETRKQYRSRLFRMRKLTHYSAKVSKEQAKEDLPLWEQIRRLAQTTKGLYNPFSKLGQEELVIEPCSKAIGFSLVRNPPGTKRRGSFVNCGPRTNKGWSFIEKRLLRKSHLAELQSDWRKARALRRERMSRVYVRDLISHRSVALRSHLMKNVDELTKNALREVEIPDSFRDISMTKIFKNYISKAKDTNSASAQMEVEGATAHGDSSSSLDKKSNVILQDQTGASVGSSLPTANASNAYTKFSAPDSEVSDSTFHDRWFTLSSFKWGNQASGAKVLDLNVPRDIFEHPNFRKSPNYAIISRHAYWRGDLEFRLFTNTNVRQYGQLQFSFYYGRVQDKNFDLLRNNIYSASQRTHSLMTANFSNTVIIKVPFEYVFPVMAINVLDSQLLDIKHIGSLIGLVVVPLTAVTGCPNEVDVKIQFRMINNSFSGMIGTAIAKGEMLSLATIIACKSLLDKNRDNPTMITPGCPVIPINSSSWCYGNGQSQFNNVLRLNPNFVLPYEQGRIPSIDEMTVDNVKDIFGMIAIKHWSKDTLSGTVLFKWDAAPMSELSEYPEIDLSGQACSVVPPISILSSLFAYWRGSMRLRVDIVGATELSGSLLICYIPRISKDKKISIEDAYTCAHTIYDIHENRQIIFDIPFVASHMFWPRRNTLSLDYPTYVAPGAIYVFCYNQLVTNCAIPNNCQLVFYLAGNKDFEVAVPACPSVGLSFNREIIIPSSVEVKFIPKEGYTPTYVDYWSKVYLLCDDNQSILYAGEAEGLGWSKFNLDKSRFKPGVAHYPPVCRYGITTDHITQYVLTKIKFPTLNTLGRVCLVKFSGLTKSNLKMYWPELNKTLTYSIIPGALMWLQDDYIYALPVISSAQMTVLEVGMKASEAAKISRFNKDPTILWCASYFQTVGMPETGDLIDNNFNCTGADWWEPTDYYATLVFPQPVSAQADEKENIEAPPAKPQDSALASASRAVFGEQFLDLKDYCRRFQLYASKRLVIKKLDKYNKWRSIAIRFPVLPQGLELDLGDSATPNEYWNRTREGPIPLIASGFRFFTGGIRYRIAINVTAPNKYFDDVEVKGKIFVQHRPNIISKFRGVMVQSGVSLGTDDMELPGYASYHQFEDLNNVLSIEVPFYVPTIRTYLQEPSKVNTAQKYSGLGELAIGLTIYSYDELRFNYDIYYALADDARFSVFVGFPPVFSITNIPNITPDSSKASLRAEIDRELDDSASSAEVVEIPDKSASVMACLKELELIKDNSERNNIIYKKINLQLARGNMEAAFLLCQKWLDSRNEASAEMGLFDKTKKMLDNATESSEKVEKILNQIDEDTISDVKETIGFFKNVTQKLKEFKPTDFIKETTETFKDKFEKYSNLIINAITNLMHCLISKFNPSSIAVAITSFFCQCKLFCFKYVDKMKDCIFWIFNKFGWSSQQPNLEGPASADMAIFDAKKSDEDDQKALAGYVSTLAAGIAAMFSIVPKLAKSTKNEIGSIIVKGLDQSFGLANKIFTFIKNNLLAMQRIKEYLFNDHPSVTALGSLKNNNDSLFTWAREVLEVTDPRKSNKVMTSPRLAAKVYEMAAQANVLKIDLMRLQLTNQEVKVLEDLIKKVHDLRDRLAKCHMAPPVRFEPFVYELTGRVGIGKSELMKKLPYEIFKFCNFTHEGELIYHRALGNAYWNNLQNQPVCTVDEKFPISGPNFADIQLAELFQLKSSCIFNPPMADIPDKNIRYNPLIVQYGSNNPFPELPEALDKSAVDRRRDCLIEVAMIPALVERHGPTVKYSQLSEKEKKCGIGKKPSPFAFLQFRYHKNVTDRRDGEHMWTKWMNYNDFKNSLCQKFRAFFQQEEVKYRSDIELMKSILPRDDDSIEIADVFKYDWLEKVGKDTNLEHNNSEQQDSILVNKIKNEYLASYKEQDKNKTDLTEKFKLRMKIGMMEAFGASTEQINPYLNKFFEIEALELASRQKSVEPQASEQSTSAGGQMDDEQIVEELLPHQKPGWDDYHVHSAECPHGIFKHALKRVDVTYDGGLQAWVIPKTEALISDLAMFVYRASDPLGRINFASDELKGTREAFDKFINLKYADTLTQDTNNYYLFSKPCNKNFEFPEVANPNIDKNSLSYKTANNKLCHMVGCCYKLPDSQREYIRKYWLLNLEAKHRLLEGENLCSWFPSDYLARAAGLRDETNIADFKDISSRWDSFKDWYGRFKENLLGADWKKWGKRLAIVISVFSFLGLVMGLWSYFSPGMGCPTEQPSSPLSSGSLSDCASLASIGGCSIGAALKLESKSAPITLRQNSDNVKILNSSSGNGHVSGDSSVRRSAVKHSSKPALRMVQSLSAHAEGGVRNEVALNQKILRNSFFLSLHDGPSCVLGRCLGICGQYALIVDHFYEAWDNVVKSTGMQDMSFISGRDGRISSLPLKFKELQYFKISESNLGLVKLPKRFPNFADIRSFIAPRSQHSNLNMMGRIVEFNLSKDKLNYLQLISQNTNFDYYYNLHVHEGKLWKEFTVHSGYQYPNFNGAGKCGSLLVANGLESPLIGMHIAGFDYRSGGISEVIYREMFDSLENLPLPYDCSAEGLESTWFVDAYVIGVGRVPQQFAHQERGKSRIVPSEVQLIDRGRNFKLFTQPAVLSPRDPRIRDNKFGPMTEGCKHHGKPLLAFPPEVILEAKNDLKDIILANCKPMRKPGLLSVDDAIGGFDARPGYEHLEFDTSEGYPFVGLRPKSAKNKRWLFNFNDQNKYESCHELLESVLEFKWKQRLDNVIPCTVFTDCLKDCTIEHEKVLEPGKTRIFSMSPVDFTIQQRQCTLDFVVAFMASRRKLEHMIGCNPDSIEWTWLAQDLLSKGDAILTGDYSKYGDTVPFEFIEAAFEIIRDWYKFNGCQNSELEAQLKIMPFEIGHAYHLMFDHIYQVVCGQPSGNSLTVIINSIANSLYIRCAWLTIMRNTQFCSLSDMHKHIQIFSYGDDLIISLSEDVKDIFNAESLHQYFASYGLKFTNANKGTEITKYTSLEDAEFLKRGFTAHPTRVLPQLILGPLKISSIEDTPNWVWSESFDRSDPLSPTFREMSMQVCADSIRNAFGRGPQYYEEWRTKVKNFWLNQGSFIKTDSWEVMDHKIFNLELNLNPYNKWLGVYPADNKAVVK